ncbi:MAG: inorganic diphosphatase [Bacilli bacterium]|mgnify:CR=1 FL=1|nr:inorganic diphosphatase [Bacilli bacterium]
MNIWHKADPNRIKPEQFLSCIEISKGSKNKYELDKFSGALILDRVLFTSTHYPQNYGFIPRTYAGDGDPLDVLVICSEPIVPLALVDCYPIGVLEMTDNGDEDMKIIAIAKNDPVYNSFKDIKNIPDHLLKEIQHFFVVYKQLEGKETVVNKVRGRAIAMKVIQESIDAYKEKFPNN